MQAWLDGQPCDALGLKSRGLAYGDGVFETVAVRGGQAVPSRASSDARCAGLPASGHPDRLGRAARRSCPLCRSAGGGRAQADRHPWRQCPRLRARSAGRCATHSARRSKPCLSAGQRRAGRGTLPLHYAPGRAAVAGRTQAPQSPGTGSWHAPNGATRASPKV